MADSVIAPRALKALQELALTVPEGIFLEVGVYRGGSAGVLNSVCEVQKRELWLFDTFEGIPEKTEGLDWHNIGDFNGTSYELVKSLLPKAKIYKGFFPDTYLPIEPKKPIAFAHVDCDQYASIKACIKELSPYMVKGGIMYFDDALVPHLPGATLAVKETFPDFLLSKAGKAYWIF